LKEKGKEVFIPYMQILPFILTLDIFSFLALSKFVMLTSMANTLFND
jgi:hypothetical protein